jgi:ketosteroid isomerase-like protein
MENVTFAGTWRGREQVGRFFNTVAQAQDVIEFAPEDFIAQGDRVVVLGRFSSRVKSTGRVSASAWAHVWTVQDAKVTRFREYVDTAAVSRAHTVAPTG